MRSPKSSLSAVGTAIALAACQNIQVSSTLTNAKPEPLAHPEKPVYRYEKCYGVARAGYNDCFTHQLSCAGTATRDNDASAWIYLPAGTCDKIIGGALEPVIEPTTT